MRVRKANRKKAEFLRQNGQTTEANKVLAGAVEVDYNLTLKFIKLCREKSLHYVVAPYEADAQIVFLVRSGHADFAISEDSDLLAYGCKQVLFKLQLSGSGDLITMNSVLESVGVDQPSFLNICIAAGCDYLPNVKGVGIVTATKVVKENANFLHYLTQMPNAPQDYGDKFISAHAIFMHQTIFDPEKSTTVPLSQWSETGVSAKLQQCCGILLPQGYAVDLAVGNVNPMEKDIVTKRFPRPTQAELWLPQDIFLNINTLQEECITWTVPCFPVLDISFMRGIAMVRGRTQPILFNAKDVVGIRERDKVSCSKWCHITIGETTYIVVWKFEKLPTRINDRVDGQLADQEQPNVEEDGTDHTLPFKVLGMSYKNRQTYLKYASEKIKNNEDVQVMIKPEPENENH